MEPLLTGAAVFLLESAAGIGIDKGVDAIAKHLSNKALLKTDEKVREYLQKHISEYDYEKIDRFFGKEGIYAHDQASCNWSAMSAYTDRIIEDFYTANTALKLEQKTLTPLIRQAVIETYQSVLSQLSTDGRIIYQQQIINREQERAEHKNFERDIQTMMTMLSQTQKKLSFAETIKYFNVLSQMIWSGNFSSSSPLVRLLENQVDDRDRSYCSALDIYLNCFIGSQQDVDSLCVQFIRDNPPVTLLKNVVTFLIQMKQKSALKILLPHIIDSELSSMVGSYVSDDSSEVKSIINSDDTLKEEYLNNEAALWLYANHFKRVGNRTAALSAYCQINQLNPTMWVHWLIEETKALLVFYDSFNALEVNVTDIKNRIDILLQFLGVFSQVSDNVCSEYIDTLLPFFPTLIPFTMIGHRTNFIC